jgi:flagellar protein FliT
MAPDDARDDVAVCRSRLLEHYEAVAAASQQMLAAARGDRWDEVAQWEERCLKLIAALKAASANAQLEDHEDERRMQLLRRILAADAEIRTRAEPWWAQLDDLYRGRVVATH